MTAVHPQIAKALEALAKANLPPLETMSPPDARVQMAAMSKARGGEPAPVKKLEDRNIPGPAGDIPVRIYWPDEAGTRGALLYLHGGGHVIGSLETHDKICRNLCVGGGVVVVSVDYRMGPEARFPAAVDDSFAALQWLAANAARRRSSRWPSFSPRVWRPPPAQTSTTPQVRAGPDVGQRIEEVDRIPAGMADLNFGWSDVEGESTCHPNVPECDPTQFTPPAYFYDKTPPQRAITGGYVYRGRSIPALEGIYLFSDFASGFIWGLDADAVAAGQPAVAYQLFDAPQGFVSFGEDDAGELFVVALDGSIYRLGVE